MVVKGSKQDKKSQSKCHNCGKKRHFKKNCWAKGRGAVKEDKATANNAVDQDFSFMAMEVSPINTVPDLDRALSALDESQLWYNDSGVTSHMANSQELFHTYTPNLRGASITGLGRSSQIVGRGSVKLCCKIRSQVTVVWLHDVAHVPGAPHNLLSLTRADDAHCKWVEENGILTIYELNGQVLMTGRKPHAAGQLYRMAVAVEAPDQAHVAILGKRTWEEMHQILGHVGIAALKKLRLEHPERMNIDKKSDDQFQCEPCMRMKQHIAPFPNKASCTPDKLKVGEIVVSNSWGPAQVWEPRAKVSYIRLLFY
jgi:hypothetical protein